MRGRWLWLLLAMVLLLTPVQAEEAEEENVVEIFTVEDLLAMQDQTEGYYILMKDLDLAGETWFCPSFSGTFDGNGHSLLNVSVSTTTEKNEKIYDTYQKSYDACFSGFFGMLENATVRDLHLVNFRALVETDRPCMLGGIAGYGQNSRILGCTVTGQLELRASNGMYGVAGLLGYGVASVEDCRADVCLISADTDPETYAEQFLGGVFAAGFISVENCQVNLRGYISEHGYVHSGGVAGMLMQYPIGMDTVAYIEHNQVDGEVSFFAHSPNRRSFCQAVIGEKVKNMNYNFGVQDNTQNLVFSQVSSYEQELRPEMCQEPDYVETYQSSQCQSFGFTVYTCKTCGYSYRDAYTLPSHSVSTWQVVEPATTTHPGESRGECDVCGAIQTRTDPVLEELPTQPQPESVPTQPTEPETVQLPEEAPKVPLLDNTWLRWLLGILGGIGLLMLLYVLTEPKGKHLRKK